MHSRRRFADLGCMDLETHSPAISSKSRRQPEPSPRPEPPSIHSSSHFAYLPSLLSLNYARYLSTISEVFGAEHSIPAFRKKSMVILFIFSGILSASEEVLAFISRLIGPAVLRIFLNQGRIESKRLCSSMSAMPSRRFARHSSRVRP
jgi:hypothetical protein